ncbi:unnamed protein product [Rhizoctonia solani]|uniref:Uncharacterized protein n=1 Tax=Rhizoctonia solani TaxID=456999 RepID=A0A8H3AGA6_9AGAM|nr:unnamed protein product [Rhizoctonia solani]
MPNITLAYFNSALQLAVPKPSQLYYVLLGIFGATIALALSKATTRKSNITMLAGPTPSSTLWGSTPEMFNAETGLEFQDELMDTYGSACWVKGPFGADEVWISDPRALQEILVKGHLEFQDELMDTYGSACWVKGPFGADEVWISDPGALQEILVKGHDDFREPAWLITWLRLVFGPVVPTIYGHQHEIQRKTPTMTNIAQRLVDVVMSEVQVNGGSTEIVDIFKWANLISLEIIGEAGRMGHSFGILEGKVPDYLAASRDMFALLTEMWYLHPFITFLSALGPAFLRRAVVECIPHRPVQRMKNVADTMHKTASIAPAVDILKRKREALKNGTLDSEVAAGKDIITALLKHNLMAAPQNQMSNEGVLAQVNSALSRTIDLLAKHQDVQARLRAEVREAYRLYGKNLDYDQLNSLPYLDAVCRESLRLHAPGTFLGRIATKDWTLPLQYPAMSQDGKTAISNIYVPKDGKTAISNIYVPKGTCLHVSLGAANRDERTWGDDAREFKPNRWLESLPASVTNSRMPGIYSSTMTFLGGPRACPGVKFAQLEMKTVLSSLVSSFKFEPSEKDKVKWKNDAIAKPYAQHPDGMISEEPTMPIRVTVLGESE